MSLEFLSLAHYGFDRAAEVLSRGFEDYLVKIASSNVLLLHLARSDSVDLAASRIVVRDGNALGAALIARRGWTARLAGMALVREARGQGVGRATVLHLLEEAKERQERSMVLEVIEQNETAVKLYEGCGFHRVRRLVGFSLPKATAAAQVHAKPPALEEVDLRSVGLVIAANGLLNLPWQMSAETVAQLSPPAVAYHLDGAWVALTAVASPQVMVRALVTERSRQGRGAAVALLRAVIARYPGKEWRMNALWPEELGQVFIEAGFTRSALSQWQMLRDIK
jgi:ribosomal protein S18 acetylase RimI-like enzyme